MKLKDDFYTIKGITEVDGRQVYDLHLNPDHFIFKAHFPGEPVTPGVCLQQMAVELAEESVGRPLALVYVKNVKFLSVVSPLQTPVFQFCVNKLVTDEEKQTVSAQMTAQTPDIQLAKLSFTCKINR